MDVEVDGEALSRIAFDGSGQDDFITQEQALPPALAARAARDGIRVRFIARDGRRTARLFGLRLLRD